MRDDTALLVALLGGVLGLAAGLVIVLVLQPTLVVGQIITGTSTLLGCVLASLALR